MSTPETETTAPVIRLRGDMGRAAENVVEDAIVDLTSGCPRLRRDYFGVKDYDRFKSQRTDGEWGTGPRHGHIVFAVELTPEARKRLKDGGSLTPEEIAEALAILRPAVGVANPLALFGPPPNKTVVVLNPERAEWVGRAAASLCDPSHDGFPCRPCLHLAERYAEAGNPR